MPYLGAEVNIRRKGRADVTSHRLKASCDQQYLLSLSCSLRRSYRLWSETVHEEDFLVLIFQCEMPKETFIGAQSKNSNHHFLDRCRFHWPVLRYWKTQLYQGYINCTKQADFCAKAKLLLELNTGLGVEPRLCLRRPIVSNARIQSEG